jgi:hypothetical protein
MAVTLHASDFFVAPTGNDAKVWVTDLPEAALSQWRFRLEPVFQPGAKAGPGEVWDQYLG